MRFIPEIGLAWLNSWIFAAGYALVLIVTSTLYPQDKRKKLWYEPHPPSRSRRWWILLMGRIAAIAFFGMLLFSPIKTGTAYCAIGITLYILGQVIFIIALLNFRAAPADQPITQGLYRYSRNPQWVGFGVMFFGSALAVASWLHLLLWAILMVCYHQQILAEEESCEEFYGDVYTAYKGKVPRYLIW